MESLVKATILLIFTHVVSKKHEVIVIPDETFQKRQVKRKCKQSLAPLSGRSERYKVC